MPWKYVNGSNKYMQPHLKVELGSPITYWLPVSDLVPPSYVLTCKNTKYNLSYVTVTSGHRRSLSARRVCGHQDLQMWNLYSRLNVRDCLLSVYISAIVFSYVHILYTQLCRSRVHTSGLQLQVNHRSPI